MVLQSQPDSPSSWRRHARVPKKPSKSPIQGWMAVALQWVRLEPDVKVRSRVTADPNRRAILVQPKSDSYLDVLFVCVRTHGSLHCTAVFKAMTTCAPLSPINRKRAGRLFQRPASSAALEGGKNQSGDPAGLARIDARVRGNGSATGARVIADRDGVPPRVPVRQHPKRSSLRLSPNDEMVANEEGLRCGQLAEPMYRTETPSRDPTPFLPFTLWQHQDA